MVLTYSGDSTNLINKFNEHGIPFTTSLGIPFSHTNVGKFVNELKQMKENDFGVDAYKDLFSSSFFNRGNYINETLNEYDTDSFIKYVGWLRQSFDSDVPTIDESLYRDDKRDEERTHNICEALRNLSMISTKNKSIYIIYRKKRSGRRLYTLKL